MDKYEFRRLDNGESVYVDFDTNMGKDSMGRITIEIDGQMVECEHAMALNRAGGGERHVVMNPSLVSDAMGFPDYCLPAKQKEALENGFSGVEFIPDPHCEGFYNVKFSCPSQRQEYEKLQGLFNKSGNNGGAQYLSERDIERAMKSVSALPTLEEALRELG